MIWSKRASASFPSHVEGSQEVERYVYTPGAAGKAFAEGLLKGVFVTEKCSGELWFPPRGFCPDLSKPSVYIEMPGNSLWTVFSYTVVRRSPNGDIFKEPVTMVYAVLEGTKGGLIHRLRPGVEPKIGMKVRAKFKPKEERKGTIEDILYFEPA